MNVYTLSRTLRASNAMVSNDQNHFVREAPPLSVPPMVVKVLEVVKVEEVVEVVVRAGLWWWWLEQDYGGGG